MSPREALEATPGVTGTAAAWRTEPPESPTDSSSLPSKRSEHHTEMEGEVGIVTYAQAIPRAIGVAPSLNLQGRSL